MSGHLAKGIQPSASLTLDQDIVSLKFGRGGELL